MFAPREGFSDADAATTATTLAKLELRKQCEQLLKAKAEKLLVSHLAANEPCVDFGQAHDEGVPDEDSEEEKVQLGKLLESARDMLESDVPLKETGIFRAYRKNNYLQTLADHLTVEKDKHTRFLLKSLRSLSKSYFELDSSKPWAFFWIVHSLRLLHGPNDTILTSALRQKIADCLQTMWDVDGGGYGGNAGQIGHLGSTFAAVCCLIELGDPSLLDAIDRDGIYRFLATLKTEEGSFRMHTDGEIDLRGLYCAASVASLLRLPTAELFRNSANHVATLQTYEGGLSPEIASEAHLGYTYCGIGALAILDQLQCLDRHQLLAYIVSRQMEDTGGFEGRTNKLSDSCYSFWGLGALSILAVFFREFQEGYPFIDTAALRIFLLGCCQETDSLGVGKGGFKDKPSAVPELYHTCYSLSGLSLIQNGIPRDLKLSQNPPMSHPSRSTSSSQDDVLEPIHPFYNVTMHGWHLCQAHFRGAHS